MFHALGNSRLTLFASFALIPFLGFCQWSGSDSQNLERIKDNIINISNGQTSIDSHVANIGYDTSDILLVIQNINRSVGRVSTAQGEYTITKGLYDIQQIAESLDRTLTISGQSGYQNTYDAKVFSRLQYVRQDMNTGFESVVNALSGLGSITNSINALARHIDNVTNYLCYSSNAFTNLSAFFQAYTWGDWTNVREEVRYLLEDILGRTPTQDEIDRATDLAFYNGTGTRFLAEYLSLINPEILPSFSWVQWFRDFSRLYQGSNPHDISNMGQLYYYQYQTRDLTDMTSNLLTRINGTASNIVTSISSINNITNRFVTGTVIDSDLDDNTLYDDEGAASNTTTSFFGKVANNFVRTFGLSGNPLETNDVQAIDSADLSGYTREIQSNAKGEEIESAVQQVNSQLSSFASDLESFSDVSGAFVLSGTTIGGVEVPDITFSTGTAPNFGALRFVFSVIKTVATIGFVLAAVTQLMRDNQSSSNALRW